VRRLLVDGLLGFRDMTVQPDRLQGFYRALTNELRAAGVTLIYTMEAPELVGPVLRAPIDRLTPVAENLILLRYVEHHARLSRLISVMKLRDSQFDPRLREFEIREGGVVIGESFSGERAVLTGSPVPDYDAGEGEDEPPNPWPEGA
jgi:circadian clock protein KaiC